ncbi:MULTISPECIES: DHA2 family efflux MFS transporter permease subunit [Bradyrhizobium]|uniref:DHA2 family efflux MFS transporter permease subunit n=1 Tax=Bradyrhizobium TaxID=374 RepID=UPI001FEE0EEF|nr:MULTISPECIES: DHA2 family efflux MFS transporter permease subunit [Bradyrhizobium]
MSTSAQSVAEASSGERSALRGWVLLLLILATAIDAINSTVLVIARAHLMDSTHTTPDEIAWVNMAYLAAKLTCFPVAAWLCLRVTSGKLIFAATTVLLASLVGCAMTNHFEVLIMWRILQGSAGAVLLVCSQFVLFEAFPRRQQGAVQAAFAFSVIMAPTTLTPALQGWAVDTGSWSWIFWASFPLALCGLIAALLLPLAGIPRTESTPFDWIGVSLMATAMTAIVFVTQEGSRYNWFDEPEIVVLTIVATIATVTFVVWQFASQRRGALIDFGAFRDEHFSFGFLVSFIAGCALFGSAFIIPAFATNVLDFSPSYAGFLLLPSGLCVCAGLLAAGSAIQFRSLDPTRPIPIGILCFMTAMWMMSGSTSQSGLPDLVAILLLRGFGLGLLFVSLTLVTLNGLNGVALAHGIALFNVGRQLGGQVGIGWLATYLDHQNVLNRTVLSQFITPGNPAFIQRREAIEMALISRGFNPEDAGQAAIRVIQQEFGRQVATVSFNECFLAVALLFIGAAPVLILAKIMLHRVSPHRPTP